MKALLTLVAWSFLAAFATLGCSSESGPQAGVGGQNHAGSGGQAQAGEQDSFAGEGGEGGEGTAPVCPSSIATADGERCSNEGLECFDDNSNPCSFGNSIVCTNGVWVRRESFPAPCGGAGGVAG